MEVAARRWIGGGGDLAGPRAGPGRPRGEPASSATGGGGGAGGPRARRVRGRGPPETGGGKGCRGGGPSRAGPGGRGPRWGGARRSRRPLTRSGSPTLSKM